MEKPVDTMDLVKTRARDCIAVRVRLLSRMVTQIYDAAMKPFGVKLNQMTILSLVYLKGEIGLEALGRRLKMEKSTASRNIERLRKAGWLDVVPAANGKRKVLRITPAGEALLNDVHEAWQDAQAKAERLLGSDGTKAVCGVADAIWRRDREG
jgi:DNA-binding MarR family transcriptional regulator